MTEAPNVDPSEAQALDPEEFEALREAVRAPGPIDLPPEPAASLERRKFIRREKKGWVVTVAGHSFYLKARLARL